MFRKFKINKNTESDEILVILNILEGSNVNQQKHIAIKPQSHNQMKVLIIGANGQIGQLIIDKMNDSSDFTPTAFIRSEDQVSQFKSKGIATAVASLEGPVDDLAKKMKGQDAIIFTAGSGGKTGPDKTLTVDLDGAVKAMEAALSSGVKRFVMVSSLRADNREVWEKSGIKPYLVAKHYADRILKEIGLDYTILRPGRLLDEPGTGQITLKNPTDQKGVPRADVASLAVEVLRHPVTISKVIEFNTGDTPITEAVQSL